MLTIAERFLEYWNIFYCQHVACFEIPGALKQVNILHIIFFSGR